MEKEFLWKIMWCMFFSLCFVMAVLPANCNRRPGRVDKITVLQSSVTIGDPHIVSDSANRLSLLFCVYEALVKLDERGQYVPSLAERWNVGEDLCTWTFTLRRGVTFHNGEQLSADDVVATMGRVLDPAIGGAFGTQGVYLSYLGDAEITAVDEYTVQIVTATPMADLFDLLVAMPISPESELANLPKNHVGSGPYKIAAQTSNETVLIVHEGYWGKPARYKEIRWLAEDSPEKRVESLLRGDADIATDIGVVGADRLRNNGAARVYEVGNTLCIIFMCNAQSGPCVDRRVRRALNYALDVETIIEQIKGGAAHPLTGYLTAQHFGFNPQTPAYPYNPEKARALLAEAGYEDGLHLTIDIPSTMPDEAPKLARKLVHYFENIGITVEVIEYDDRAAYSEMVRAKDIHDACCFDSSPRSTYRVLREKIQSTLRGPWWQGYENTQVDALIERASTTFDEPARRDLYRQIYTIIRDDAPWVFLYNPIKYRGVSARLGDLKLRADGLLIFE